MIFAVDHPLGCNMPDHEKLHIKFTDSARARILLQKRFGQTCIESTQMELYVTNNF